jgi:hypothetical protein
MELLQNPNPEIVRGLTDPINIRNLNEAIGINTFEIPGEDDRQKQLEEIKLLSMGAPVPDINPETMQEEMQPSVPIEPLVDAHDVHAAVCRKVLVSERGRQMKQDNPDGYQNILLHMQAHMQLIPPISQPQTPQNQGTPAAPKGDATPLAEKTNVPTAS